jgi:hypothetical protein
MPIAKANWLMALGVLGKSMIIAPILKPVQLVMQPAIIILLAPILPSIMLNNAMTMMFTGSVLKAQK